MALIPEDPAQRNALIAILAVLAAAYFFNDLWLSDRKEEIAEMEARLETLEDQNRRAQIIAARGGNLEERLAVYERHVGKLEELIPAAEEVPALLNSISSEALRWNVELSATTPEPPEPGPFYTRRSYDVSVVGEYHDIGGFLTAVASLRRIITPVELELQPFTGSAPDMVAPLLARFRIQTYVLPDDGAGPQEGEQAEVPT